MKNSVEQQNKIVCKFLFAVLLQVLKSKCVESKCVDK